MSFGKWRPSCLGLNVLNNQYIIVIANFLHSRKNLVDGNQSGPLLTKRTDVLRQDLASLEAVRFGFKHFPSLWKLTGTLAAPLPRCLLNFRAIRSLWHQISRIRDFARFGGKTSYRLVNRGPQYRRAKLLNSAQCPLNIVMTN